jgi:hypothetical protein
MGRLRAINKPRRVQSRRIRIKPATGRDPKQRGRAFGTRSTARSQRGV